MGFKMGAPIFQQKHLIRQFQVQVYSSNYQLYGDMSHRVMSLLQTYAPDFEIYSIDEIFLRFTGFSEWNLSEYGINIRKHILRGLKIPVSVGIGPTKTLAKVANYFAKKYPHLIKRKFNSVLARTVLELQGIACFTMENPSPRRNIMVSHSFGKPIVQLQELREAVGHYASRAAEKCRQQNAYASGIMVFIKTSPFNDANQQYTNAKTIAFPKETNSSLQILQTALDALYSLHFNGISLLTELYATVRFCYSSLQENGKRRVREGNYDTRS